MGWGRGATLLASVGPSGMRGGVGRIWEHQTLRNLSPPHLACGSLPYTKGMASPGARLSKALAELVVSNGNWEETWKLGLRDDEVVDYGKGLASSGDPLERGGSEQVMGRAGRRLLKQEDPSVLPPPPHRA